MINSISIGASALKVYQTKTDVIAHNVANINTEGFKPKTVHLKENNYSNIDDKTQVGSGVSVDAITENQGTANLATEFTELIKSQRSFEANVKTIKTADEMLGTLLDGELPAT